MRIVLFAAASFAALRIQQLMDAQYSTGKRAAVTHLAKSPAGQCSRCLWRPWRNN